MTVEVKQSKSTEQKLAERLKSSGDPRADVITKHGEGARRTFHHVFHSGHVIQPNTQAKESGPQEQRHHDEATTQSTTAYFRGHGKHEEGND